MAATAEAARALLSRRTEWVVVTSAAPSEAAPGTSRILIVTEEGHEVVEWKQLDTAAKGTGDLFTAALTSGLLSGAPLEAAVRSAHERVVAVLERTTELNANELVLT